MKRIGFVGLGNMGSKMVVNLLEANYEVIGYDINEEFINSLNKSEWSKIEVGSEKKQKQLVMRLQRNMVIYFMDQNDNKGLH